MSQFERIVAAFNEGRVDDVVDTATADYTYSDPITGTTRGATQHVALMRQVLERFPDRSVEIVNSWHGDGAKFAEYRWTGTPADGGEPVEMTSPP